MSEERETLPTASGRTLSGRLGACLWRLLRSPAWVLAVAAFFATLVPIYGNDIWYHLRTGEYVVQHHAVPQQDVFSHTMAGKQWISHYWGGSTLLYLIYRAGGLLGVRLANSLACALAILLLYALYRHAAGRAWLAAAGVAIVLADFVGRFNWRPEIFSIPFLILAVGYLLRYDRSRPFSARELAVWGALAVLWANIHSMELLAVMCAGAFATGETATLLLARRITLPEWSALSRRSVIRAWALVVVGAVAALVTPNTYLVYAYLRESARHSLGAPLFIAEWQSPVAILGEIFSSLRATEFSLVGLGHLGQFFFLLTPLLYFLALPVLVRLRRTPTLGEVALGLYCIYMGSSVVRLRYLFFVPLFWVVAAGAAVLDAEESAAPAGERTGWRKVLLASSSAVAAAVCVGSLLNRPVSFTEPVDESVQPVGIANFLSDADVGGRLFNSYNWGAYLIFRLAGRYPVFIDGRNVDYERADPNITRDYVSIERQVPGFRDLLDRWRVQLLLGDGRFFFPTAEEAEEIRWARQVEERALREDDQAADAESLPPPAQAGEDWVLLLADADGSVYVRRPPAGGEAMAGFAHYFTKLGLPWSDAAGVDLASLILHRPDLAERWKVLPAGARTHAWALANRPGSPEALAAWLAFGRALTQIGFLRDAAAAYDRALGIERYNLEALHGSAHTHHLLGDDDLAIARLESATLIGDRGLAATLLRHCRQHQPPASPLALRLPDPATFWQLWVREEVGRAAGAAHGE